MKIFNLEGWIAQEQPRSHKHNQIRVKYNCKECQKEIIKRPSAIKKKNLERLFCSLGCSTRYRNLHDGVPAQKEGWKERWLEASIKNNTLPVKDKNPRWIKDREAIEFVQKNQFKYTQILNYALNKKYKTFEWPRNFYYKHGYTIEQLKNHIEKQFQDGMAWNNYGEWEVDHIKATSEFLYKKIIDFKIINALENLRPLWKSDNRKKNKFQETVNDL